MTTNVTNTIINIGANDHDVDLFEGQYIVPNGMAYNSYAIIDDKIAIMDTIDKKKTEEWLANIDAVLSGRKLDYLAVPPAMFTGREVTIRPEAGSRTISSSSTWSRITRHPSRRSWKNTVMSQLSATRRPSR